MAYSINAKEIQEKLTEKFIAILESGRISEWRQTWQQSGVARRAGDGYIYRGVNQLSLAFIASELDWPNIWGTHGQFANLSKKRKEVYNWVGAKSQAVVLKPNMRKIEVDDEKKPGEKKKIYIVKSYTAYPVLNIAQVKGTEKLLSDMSKNKDQANADAEKFIAAQNAVINSGHSVAAYNPKTDEIRLPAFSDFETAGAYYATALHELVHWTGNETRLKRKLSTDFGSADYANEELIAELGSAMTCALVGVSGEHIDNHAAYLGHWVKMLKEKPAILAKASSKAFDAMAYLAKNAGHDLSAKTDE